MSPEWNRSSYHNFFIHEIIRPYWSFVTDFLQNLENTWDLTEF